MSALMTTYRPVLVTPPEETPVTLDEAKAHLGVSGTTNDLLITSMIEAAASYLDGYDGILGRALVTQTWSQTYDRFCERLRLPLPAASIDEVRYIDAEGAEQSVAEGTFVLRNTDADGPHIMAASGYSWPTAADQAEAVTVTFTAGYGAAEAVPGAIKAAMLLMVGKLYRMSKRDPSMTMERVDGIGTRQWTTTAELSAAVDVAIHSILSPFKRVGL